MTNKLVVIINSLKVQKIKKNLLYEMKFLVPNYSCLQNPWLGGYRPQIPVLSVLCPQLNLLNPPRRKFLGTPLVRDGIFSAIIVPPRTVLEGPWVRGQVFRICIECCEETRSLQRQSVAVEGRTDDVERYVCEPRVCSCFDCSHPVVVYYLNNYKNSSQNTIYNIKYALQRHVSTRNSHHQANFKTIFEV